MTPATTLKTSFGKAFRSPTLYDLYRTWKYGKTTYKSNPDLKPEWMYSYELGIEQRLFKKILGKVFLYYNDVRNLIYSVDTGKNIKEKQNVCSVDIRGYEAAVRYDITDKINGFINYTYNCSKIKEFEKDKSLEGKILIYAPKHKISAGISYSNQKLLDVDLTGRYVEKQFHDDKNIIELDDYYTFDIIFSRKINDGIDVFAKCENLLDRKYQEYKGFLAPGRTITVGSNWRF